MEGLFNLIGLLAGLVLVIMIFRLVGAWMLRINDVIYYQKKLIDSVDQLNQNLGNYLEEENRKKTNPTNDLDKEKNNNI